MTKKVKKTAKKPTKKATAKKPTKKAVKKTKKTQETLLVAPVVSPSGIVTMTPVPDDQIN